MHAGCCEIITLQDSKTVAGSREPEFALRTGRSCKDSRLAETLGCDLAYYTLLYTLRGRSAAYPQIAHDPASESSHAKLRAKTVSVWELPHAAAPAAA